MVGKTESRTKADDRRFELIVEIGCIACAVEGWPGVPCQIHHLLDGGERRGHRYTVGICPWHHEGKCSGSVRETTRHYGPSLAHNPRLFVERYGTDDELLMIQDAMCRMVESAHGRGEYLPADEITHLVRLLHREVVLHRAPSARAVSG